MALSHFLNVVKQLGIDQELLCHVTREQLKQNCSLNHYFYIILLCTFTFCDMHYTYKLVKYVAGFFELFIPKINK